MNPFLVGLCSRGAFAAEEDLTGTASAQALAFDVSGAEEIVGVGHRYGEARLFQALMGTR